MDQLETVTLELRPGICVINVFIRFKDSYKISNPSITFINQHVNINFNDKTIQLPLVSTSMNPSSFSSLATNNNYISFRIQTTPSDRQFGTFRAEILNYHKTDTESCTTVSSVELPKKDCPTKFHCGSCKQTLSKVIHLQRILPLPRQHCDSSEWFCCKHNVNEKINNFSLTPKETDYFYGSYYFILNNNVLESRLKSENIQSGEIVRCSNCSSVIGQQKDMNSMQLWNCLVEKQCGDVILPKSKPLDDFFLALKEATESSLDDVLIETKVDGLFRYIFVKPTEKKVDHLIESSKDFSCGGNVVPLKKVQVMRMLFKFGESDKSMLKERPEVIYCQLDETVFSAGLNHLIEMANRYTPNYREIDDSMVGCIVLPEMSKFFT